MRILFIVAGIAIIVFALFLTFGVVIYSLKERDEFGFVYLILPVIALITGIFLIKSAKIK